MTRRSAPISCSLNADELSERRAAWHALGERLDVVERIRFPGGFRMTLQGSPHDIEAVGDLVAAERQCCGWAEWQLDQAAEGAVLTVSGREDLVAPLAQSFLQQAAP